MCAVYKNLHELSKLGFYATHFVALKKTKLLMWSFHRYTRLHRFIEKLTNLFVLWINNLRFTRHKPPEGGFDTPHLTKCVSQMQYNANEYEFAIR